MGIWMSSVKRNQKRMIRVITARKYNTHADIQRAWPPLNEDKLDLSSRKFYYRSVYDNHPVYFYSFRIVTQIIHHNYDTRNHIDQTTTQDYAEQGHKDMLIKDFLFISPPPKKKKKQTNKQTNNSTSTSLLDKMPLTVSRVPPLLLRDTSSFNIMTFDPSQITTFSSYLIMIGNCCNTCNIFFACFVLSSLSRQQMVALYPVCNAYSGGYHGSSYKALVELFKRSQWHMLSR